jgi:ATP-dependent RNA helicase DeaD
VPALQIAAALAQLSQGDAPFLLQSKPHRIAATHWEKEARPPPEKAGRSERSRRDGPPAERRKDGPPSEGMERYRIAVGHDHGVMPGNIVGAIANEANIGGQSIGRINIHDNYSLIDLPAGLPKETFAALKKVWVSGRKLDITRMGDKGRDDQGRDDNKKRAGGKRKFPEKLTLPKGKSRKKTVDKSKGKLRKHR